MIANAHKADAHLIRKITKATNFSEDFNLIDYLNRSQYFTDELISDCELKQKPVECSKIFKRVLMSYLTGGCICFSFNQENFHTIFNEEISHDFDSFGRGLPENFQWTLEGGYQTTEIETIPSRASETEISFSFKVFEKSTSSKFFVDFQKPTQMASNTRSYDIRHGEGKTFIFSAKVSSYSEDFRKFSPEKRGCYFSNERKLKYFKAYTEKNCLDECLSNYTLQTCGCVKFSMPRNDSTQICIWGDESRCYMDVIYKFPTKDVGIPPCGCYMTCHDIEYFIQMEKNQVLKEPQTKNFRK